MPITPKPWQDSPSTVTPLSAAALADLETRLGAYIDQVTNYIADTIFYNGTVWVQNGGAGSPFTVSFSASALHITHADVGVVFQSRISVTNMAPLRPVLKRLSVTTTGFDVEWYDSAGTVVAAPSVNMAIGVVRRIPEIAP